MQNDVITGRLISAEGGRIVIDVMKRTNYLIATNTDVALKIADSLPEEVGVSSDINIDLQSL